MRVSLQYRPSDDLAATVTVIRVSRRIMLIALFLCLVLLGAGVVQCLHLIPDRRGGWSGYGLRLIQLGGGGAVGCLWRLLSRKPVFVLDELGLTDHQTGLGLIPWSQVTGARMVHVGIMTYVCLNLVDAAEMRRKRGWAASRISNMRSQEAGAAENEVVLQMGPLDMGAGELLRRIERYRRADHGAK